MRMVVFLESRPGTVMSHKCEWMSLLNEDCAMETCDGSAVVKFMFPNSRTEYYCGGHARIIRENLGYAPDVVEAPLSAEEC
jgi:hypothetical protein